MRKNIQRSIQSGIDFLASNQRHDGRFSSLVSDSRDQFGRAQVNDSIFTTALILGCIASFDDAQHIVDRSVDYLLAQRSENWTWNYWERGSTSRPYPDDLDDTACVLAGIAVGHQHLITPQAHARIARALIYSEAQTGGPYATWLMPSDQSLWRDVDIVVNANVGYMLSTLGVQNSSLEAYITQSIMSGALTSPYYIGIVPAIYFISRWYKGAAQGQLAELIVAELKNPQNVLYKAMLVTAAINMGHASLVADLHINDLLHAQIEDGWVAAALYYEPPQNGTVRFAGSPELTTAFVIEALQKYLDATRPVHNRADSEPQSLSSMYAMRRKVMVDDNRSDVMRIANVVAKACGVQLGPGVLPALNKGSLDGWIAYTLYDAILDGDEQNHALCVANEAMRRSLRHFRAALPGKEEFIDFAESAYAKMDSANIWELLNARNIDRLPSYGNLAQLAYRSWGQVVAPTGVLMAAGYSLRDPEVRKLHDFMKHYSIAKQLSDDAHDWQDDLAKGRVTVVVAMLVRDCPEAELSDWQRYFWDHTVNKVNKLIRFHLAQAQSSLHANEAIIHPTGLQAWLDAVESSCQRAEQGKQAVLDFIHEFTAENLIK